MRTGPNRKSISTWGKSVEPEDEQEPEPQSIWTIWYTSCEGNRRWFAKTVPASWSRQQVEDSITIGGCGDDVAEILSVELGAEL